ncbi:hypothetical protein KFL_006790070 [Klebsormidium nitens]|uniref:SWIM-type domain-containing protein n=1 Tax=Klebsormidium nitens TaxID=105231 RepID=A0A1Y1IIW7_KLENI|nr:hypothetical protein KFL_006790070 [Klebsormidium nitens]|eukprot:GAQ90744.1 hypothetical protein KFL_006790070 [Klebsormidium nitens]
MAFSRGSSLSTASASRGLPVRSTWLAQVWNHNAARIKPLGRPSKACALLETVHRDTTGDISCTCDRGRLYSRAPCVHKLALQALESPRLASAVSLQKGPRVVEVPCDRAGERVFGVCWNAGSPSPKRTMVHYGEAAQMGWFCEGEKDGCSKRADCSHIKEVKRALDRPGGADKPANSVFSESQLELAVTSLRTRVVDSRGGGVTAHGGPSTTAFDVDGYIAELVVGSHERAACAGPDCFCKQHPRALGGNQPNEEPCTARCCTSAQTNGKRARSEQAESSGDVAGASARSIKRRGCKSYWAAADPEHAETEKSEAANGSMGQVEPDEDEAFADETGRRTDNALRIDDQAPFLIPVCNACACPSSTCPHGASSGVATVLPMDAEGVQLEVPKLVRPNDSWQVHDPEVLLLRNPVRVSELTARDFGELSAAGALSAPCPRTAPPCGTEWLGLWQRAQIHDLGWSQEVKLRIYCCVCPEKHTVHFNGEALGLYAWKRGVVITQAACQLMLRSVQHSGAAFNALVAAGAPSQGTDGGNVRKVMEAGSNYCAASLFGGGLKTRLVQQPEIRTLIARYSAHHTADPELGKTPSAREYEELLIALNRDDVQGVTDFVPDPDDADADPVLLHWRRWVRADQVGQMRSKNKAAHELHDGIEREAMQEEACWPPHCPSRWAELVYTLGAPHSVSDDSNLIQHGKALSVIRKLLLGGAANDDDKVVLAEHSPILRRLLDHYGDRYPRFFYPTLHHLYRLTLFGRGAVGLGVGRAGWALSAIEGLDVCVWLGREPNPLTVEQQQAFDFWAARANALLPGVENLSPPAPHEYALLPPERTLLNDRLGLEPDGSEPGPLPADHPYGREQRELGCYPLPGWEQKRPLPQYEPFEDDLGRSLQPNEEHRCRSGLMVGEFDAKIALESGVKKARSLRRHTKGGFVFCCSHRVIYGFHVMLRGESPRDPFTVLYTRLNRHDLPAYLVYDNACKLRAYVMRREPTFFAEVRFLVDRFHFQRTTSEAHKCGPSYNPDYYDSVRWVNTSAVESCNAFLVNFKTQAWYRSLVALMIILANLVSGRNSDLKRVDEPKLRIAGRADTWWPAVRQHLLLC